MERPENCAQDESSSDIVDALNMLENKKGHIEVTILPKAIQSLFTGRLVIAPAESQSQDEPNQPPATPQGLITLGACAEWLTAKFAHQFTERELKEWCDAGYMPHVRVQGKGISVYASKVGTWVKRELLEVYEGGPFDWNTKPVYTHEPRRPAAMPKELVALADSLHYLGACKYPPCVYFLIHNRTIIYIGKTVNLLSRIGSHVNDKTFNEIYYLPVPESRLDEVEQAFIRVLQPKRNGTHKATLASENDYVTIAAFGKSPAQS